MPSDMHGTDHRGPRAALLGLVVAGLTFLAACGGDQREMKAPQPDQTTTTFVRGTTTTQLVPTTTTAP